MTSKLVNAVLILNVVMFILNFVLYCWSIAKLTKALGVICLLVGIPTNVASALLGWKQRQAGGSATYTPGPI